MKRFNGKSKEELEAIANDLNRNAEQWDDGTLGESPKHAKPMKSYGENQYDNILFLLIYLDIL